MLIDWGCGTGELTLPLCGSFERVIAIDVSSERIDIAKDKAKRDGVSNIDWRIDEAENIGVAAESCDLITSASAFHWMDRDLLCRRAFQGLKPDGALVLVGGAGADIWSCTVDWHEVAVECLERYLDEPKQEPPAPPRDRSTTPAVAKQTSVPAHGPPLKPKSHSDFLQAANFNIEQLEYPTEFSWPVDQVAGYMYSITGGLPWNLGEQRESFEREFSEKLLRRNPSGVVSEVINFFLLIGRKC